LVFYHGIESEIREIINRETEAWNQKNVEKLLSIFHPDMVWPWPRTTKSHDTIDWVMELGRFNHQRWSNIYSELFGNHELIYNNRIIGSVQLRKTYSLKTSYFICVYQK
jgi:hypothetical protein